MKRKDRRRIRKLERRVRTLEALATRSDWIDIDMDPRPPIVSELRPEPLVDYGYGDDWHQLGGYL